MKIRLASLVVVCCTWGAMAAGQTPVAPVPTPVPMLVAPVVTPAPAPVPPPAASPPPQAPSSSLSPVLTNPGLVLRPYTRAPALAPAPATAPINQQTTQAYRNELLSNQRQMELQGVNPGSDAYRTNQQQLNQLNDSLR